MYLTIDVVILSTCLYIDVLAKVLIKR